MRGQQAIGLRTQTAGKLRWGAALAGGLIVQGDAPGAIKQHQGQVVVMVRVLLDTCQQDQGRAVLRRELFNAVLVVTPLVGRGERTGAERLAAVFKVRTQGSPQGRIGRVPTHHTQQQEDLFPGSGPSWHPGQETRRPQGHRKTRTFGQHDQLFDRAR